MKFKLNFADLSTWAGIAGVALALGQAFPQYSIYAQTIATVAGAVAALFVQRGSSADLGGRTE